MALSTRSESYAGALHVESPPASPLSSPSKSEQQGEASSKLQSTTKTYVVENGWGPLKESELDNMTTLSGIESRKCVG